jgi:hypothetical protein
MVVLLHMLIEMGELWRRVETSLHVRLVIIQGGSARKNVLR